MTRSRWLRRALVGACSGIALMMLALALLIAAVDAGCFKSALLALLERRTGRHFDVSGAWHTHLFSMHPTIEADGVRIGNPPWSPPGLTAEVGHLMLGLHLPWLSRPLSIDRLELDSATLNLLRDEEGRANWQWHDPGIHTHRGTPLINALSVPAAHVRLNDKRHRLDFDGTVTAGDDGRDTGAPFRLQGAGQMNGRAVTLTIEGDPLAEVAAEHPYRFRYVEESSGTRLAGSGVVPRPFLFGTSDLDFTADGEDLADLYFLVGVRLINTGRYHLTGSLQQRGTTTLFPELAASSGDSDIRGRVEVDASSGHSKLDIELSSRLLRTADLGLRAAGRAPPEEGRRLLMSGAAVNPQGVRHGDATVHFTAQRLAVGRVELRAVAARLSIENGVAQIAPLTATLYGGRLTGQFRFDATRDPARTNFDLRVNGAEIGEWPRKDGKPAVIEGRVDARAKGSGSGNSLHEVAASADGTLTLIFPHGAIKESLAELSGLDLKGVGLALAKSDAQSEVRCAVASFQAKNGLLTADTLVMDTTPVLVTGTGTVEMENEALDLTLHGTPKRPELRLRAPVHVKGTLAAPTFAIEPGHTTAGQAAGAVALGTLLAPLTSLFAFVDPGLAKDADCRALIDGAKTAQKH